MSVSVSYLNAREYQQREIQLRNGASVTVEDLTGPVHAVQLDQAAGGPDGLRSVCGRPVIATLPVHWPAPVHGARLCRACTERLSR
jgi:hypothetical protein